MHTRLAVFAAVPAFWFAACTDRPSTTAPSAVSVEITPSAVISDGAHGRGNPEFFFLPPLTLDPSGSPNFDAGKFAWHLRPVVLVYALPTSAWKPGDGPDKCIFSAGAVYGPALGVVQPPVEQYAVNWKTPTNLPLRTYRVCVFSSRGGTLLGFLDVQPVQGGMKIPKSSGSTYTFTRDGRTLPIKFRIETGALCPPAYDTECLSATMTLSTQVADTIILPSGHAALVIPAQTNPPTGGINIAFEEESPPYNDATTCLPPSLLVQSRGCYHASATSGGVAYTFNPAVTVEICVAVDQLTAEQASQLRLFKYNAQDGVQQWPWVEPTLIDCSTYAPLAPTGGGLGAVLRRLGTLAQRVFAPEPLSAAGLSLPPKGVGGSDKTFSDFGGGLLSSIGVNGGNDQTALAGEPVPIPPSVVVHDTAGHPVSGVQVTFAVTSGGGRVMSGEAIGDSVVATTGSDGIASLTSWILGPTAGANTLSARAYEFVGSPVAFAATATAPPQCSNVTEITPAECGALVALYNATDGSNWWNHTDWLQTNTPCTWFGITCAGGAVRAVVLNYNNLTGVLPSELGNLVALETLRLDSNLVVSGPIPATLGNLSHLRTLNLSSNRLNGGLPTSLGNLTSLDTLSAQTNLLTGAIPVSLGRLTALQSLALDNNQLSGSIPAAIGNLASLKSLSLGGNQLTGALPTEVGTLASLESLELGFNQLSGAIPATLGSLSHLGYLNLQSNLFTGQLPTALGNLASLQYLYLYNNQISGTIPASLVNLTALRILDLRQNQISGTIPNWLGSLTNLTQLYLSSNQLSGGIPPELGNLTQLITIQVDGNQLVGTIPTSFGNLTLLDGVHLESNQLTGLMPLGFAQIGGRLRWNCTVTPGNAGLYVPDTPDYRAADIYNFGSICGLPFTPLGPVQIDGAMSPGEWDQADHYTGTVTLPDNSTTSVDIFVTNDATSVYTAVRFGRDVSAWGSNIDFRLDENQNGAWDGHEDGWVAQSYRQYGGGNPPNLFLDQFFSSSVQPPQGQLDDEYGGTNDGAMAAGTGGTVVEMVHPLHNSLDAAHDAQLLPGNSFGFWVGVNMPQYPVTVTTILPAAGTWTYTVR